MALTDTHDPYTVRYSYSLGWVEIIRGGTSLCFMQGEEAAAFLAEYVGLDPDVIVRYLSDYDYLASDAGWA